MGQIQLSENTIQRNRPRHGSHGSRTATILTTMLTLLILVALGALVLNYVSNARPQVATTVHAQHSISDSYYPSHISGRA